METLTVHNIIKHSLPKPYWNEVISALKHDPVVWKALQDHLFLEKLHSANTNEIDLWIPANLGLKYIGLPQRAKDFQNSHSPLLEKELFNQALILLEDIKEDKNISNLNEAILIALALREKYCLGDSWHSIQRDLRRCFPDNLRSVMVCLFGLVDNPNELLGNFMFGKTPTDNYINIIHTILSNPIGVDRQSDLLIDVIVNNRYIFSPRPLDHLNAIQYLSLINPALATILSNKLLNYNLAWTNYESSDHFLKNNSLQDLEIQLLNSELAKLTDTTNESNFENILELKTISDLLVDLSVNHPHLFSNENIKKANDDFDEKSYSGLLLHEDVITNHPNFLENTLLLLLESKEYDQAMDFLLDHRSDITSNFLSNCTLAICSYNRGEIQESIINAQNALEDVNDNDEKIVDILLKHHETVLYEFIKLLNDLDLHLGSVHLIQKALSICPSNVNFHLMMGEALLSEDLPDKALASIYDASMFDPDNIDIRKRLAYCLERIGNWGEAYQERKYILEEVQNHDQIPDISDLHALAECALNLDYYDETIRLSEQAITQNNENGYSHSLIGKALLKQGETESAFEQFGKGIQLSPSIPEVWLALFEAQIKEDDITGAIETLHAASQAIPESTEIHLALGEIQLTQNALTEALATFKHGAELDPKDPRLALKLGKTLHLLGHLDDARQVLEEAQQLRFHDPEIAYEHAKVLLELGDKISTLPLLEIVVNANPQHPEPYLEYAEAIITTNILQENNHHFDKVIKVLKTVIELDANNSKAYALLGELLAAKGEFLEAKQAFQIALESDLAEEKEWFARLSLGMGRVALALGKEDVALASLQEAVQVDPNNPLIHRTLAEVYQAVNLIDNALQAARSALNLAIDDVDTLSWYADQMLRISEKESEDSSDISSTELLKQVQIEALNALQQAIQIAPEHTDLIVKLGKLQLHLGERTNVIKTLNSLIENEHSSTKDLATAGKMLAEIGDNCGAIACLEKATSISPEGSNQQSPMLLLELANLYHIEEIHDSALDTLNKAQQKYPTFAPIYSTKANILLSLKNIDTALVCTLEGLERSSEDENKILIYQLASEIFRIKGDLREAIEHGLKGLSLCKHDSKTPEHIISTIRDTITLTSELYRAILNPNRGRMLLKDMERKFNVKSTNDIDYCCTYLELFFDSVEDKELTSLISQIVERHPNHPRILSLQARILYHRGDYKTSLQLLNSALDSANQKSWRSKINSKDTHIPSLLFWYSIFDTALELNQWETAFYIARKILDQAPEEPRAHINLAKVYVCQAEYQRLCETAEVITHAPGTSALMPETRKEFEQALSIATQKLPYSDVKTSDSESSSDAIKINPIINRWHARGLVVFGNQDEIIRGIGDLVINQKQNTTKKSTLDADDATAILSAEARLGKLDDELDIAKHIHSPDSFPFESKLHLQTAIAIATTNPIEAINLLHQFSEQIRSKESPYRAIANGYSARIALHNNQIEEAKVSIDSAIEIWPNEPRWQILAAEIYQNLGNITEAVHHTDEAILLEPNCLAYHLKLGKLLTENSDIDPTYPTRAIQTLEKACRLEPEVPETWQYLSRAYLLKMDIDQAVTCSDMAITLAPDRYEPLVTRGEIALHENKPMTALEYADKALEIQNQDIQAILIKSQALKDLGKPSEALQVLESVMEKMDDPLSIHIEYALLLNDVRGPQASIQALEALAEQNPGDPFVLSLLAKNMAEAGETDDAIDIAQRALQISNGNLQIKEKAELHYLLGKLLFQVRQLDQAIHHLSESIDLLPNFVEPYIELGHSYQERRQFRQALDVYQKATQIAPRDFRSYYHAGIALKEGKDYQSSESMLRRAADLAPDDVNIRRQLAAVVALNLVHNPRPQRIVEE